MLKLVLLDGVHGRLEVWQSSCFLSLYMAPETVKLGLAGPLPSCCYVDSRGSPCMLFAISRSGLNAVAFRARLRRT